MSTETLHTFLYFYFLIGALLLVSTVGWYAYRFTRHYGLADVQDAIAGKKKIVDPAVTDQLRHDARWCRRVMIWWFVSLIVLAVAISLYNTLHRE